jgi:hypothetical protein
MRPAGGVPTGLSDRDTDIVAADRELSVTSERSALQIERAARRIVGIAGRLAGKRLRRGCSPSHGGGEGYALEKVSDSRGACGRWQAIRAYRPPIGIEEIRDWLGVVSADVGNRVGELMLHRLSCSDEEFQMHKLDSIAAWRGDGLRPELRALFERLATNRTAEPFVRPDGMVQSGPDPQFAETEVLRLRKAAGWLR